MPLGFELGRARNERYPHKTDRRHKDGAATPFVCKHCRVGKVKFHWSIKAKLQMHYAIRNPRSPEIRIQIHPDATELQAANAGLRLALIQQRNVRTPFPP